MTAAVLCAEAEAEVLRALGTVTEPEFDEAITDVGFVRAVHVDEDGITVHLRLPTSGRCQGYAYLVASDALDALRELTDTGRVLVVLDGHHDGVRINAGLAAEAGHPGSNGDESLAEPREAFRRAAHAAAVERAIGSLMRHRPMDVDGIRRLTLRDLPEGKPKTALLRRRFAIGLSNCPNSRVLIGEAIGSVLGRTTLAP